MHGCDRPVDERQPFTVGREHAAHDLFVDPLRLGRDAGDVVQVARPLDRAHSHQRPLDLCVPAAAALAHVRAPHLVPNLLGLDQHSVQVEDDPLDHSEW